MSGLHFNVNPSAQNPYQINENTNTHKSVKRNIESVQPSVEVDIKTIMSRDSAAKHHKNGKDGDYYFNLYVNTTDDAKAAVCLQKAANLGHRKALYDLGIGYYENNNSPEKLAKAIFYLEQSAHLNFTPAKVILGFIYSSEPSIDLNEDIIQKIITLWTEAAEERNMEAQLYLGILYLKDKLVPKDFHNAIDFLNAAAEQGSPMAKYYLGIIYSDNPDVPDSNTLAFDWFMKAARAGFVKANYKLGIMLEGGIGTNRNIEQAISFYTKAADHNYNPALHRLGDIYITGRNIPQNVRKGLAYFKKAAENGYADSQLELGVMYKSAGQFTLAIRFLTAAAEQESSDAQFVLAQIYEQRGPHHNISKAYSWFAKAAQNDHVEAGEKLAPQKTYACRSSKTV